MPTAYLDTVTLEAYLTGDLNSRATASQKQSALTRAASEADGYLAAGGYAVPAAGSDITPAMQGAVGDMARYHLASALRLLPEPASGSAAYTAYQDALAWWRDVARGSVPLEAATADGTDSAPGEAQIATTASRDWRGGW